MCVLVMCIFKTAARGGMNFAHYATALRFYRCLLLYSSRVASIRQRDQFVSYTFGLIVANGSYSSELEWAKRIKRNKSSYNNFADGVKNEKQRKFNAFVYRLGPILVFLM